MKFRVNGTFDADDIDEALVLLASYFAAASLDEDNTVGKECEITVEPESADGVIIGTGLIRVNLAEMMKPEKLLDFDFLDGTNVAVRLVDDNEVGIVISEFEKDPECIWSKVVER